MATKDGGSQFRAIGRSPSGDRTFYLAAIRRLEDWPQKLNVRSDRFVLLCAADARSLSADQIGVWSQMLLRQGLAYFCAWGPDCQRVHDIIDEEIVARDLERGGGDNSEVIMTTWHSDDSLEEAVGYFVESAWPPDAPDAAAWIAVAVGDPTLASIVEKVLEQQLSTTNGEDLESGRSHLV